MAVEFSLPSALSHFDPTELFDALSTGIIVLDAQLCPIYANVAAQNLLAFSLNQARGRPFGDFLHDTSGSSAFFAARSKRARASRIASSPCVPSAARAKRACST
ncbi:MAG: PAS domain-containing protein [Gammaproteobacteria bacterium]